MSLKTAGSTELVHHRQERESCDDSQRGLIPVSTKQSSSPIVSIEHHKDTAGDILRSAFSRGTKESSSPVVPIEHHTDTAGDILRSAFSTDRRAGDEFVPDEPLQPQGSLLHAVDGGEQGEGATNSSCPQYQPFTARQRWWMVSLFTLTAALLFADQNVLAPNLTDAARYYGISDRHKDMYLGGWVAAAFFIVGAPASLIIGFLTDEYNRRNLLFWVVVIGQGPMILVYWTTEWWQFLILRTMTGIAVGGVFPLVFSLLADLFPITQRTRISGLVQIATAVGIGFGQFFSALVAPETNWRIPFVLVAIPSMLCAIVMRFTTHDPPRGAMEKALASDYQNDDYEYKETISWPKVKILLKIPSNWFCILQGLPGCLPWGMFLTYFNDYLVQDKHLNKGQAAGVIVWFSVGGAGGVIVGSLAGQWAYNRKKELIVLFMGVPVLLGILPTYFLINSDLKGMHLGVAFVMSLIAGFVVSLPGPNLRAVIMNVNVPETRGVSMALLSMTEDLGKGLGPLIVAAFVTLLGRRNAFNLSTAGWIPCGILLLLPLFTITQDEDRMQAQLLQAKQPVRESVANVAESESPTRHRQLELLSSPVGVPLLSRLSSEESEHVVTVNTA